ncbi:unnamed protein product, partial [Ectocarpus sp. 12 AP-2014]
GSASRGQQRRSRPDATPSASVTLPPYGCRWPPRGGERWTRCGKSSSPNTMPASRDCRRRRGTGRGGTTTACGKPRCPSSRPGRTFSARWTSSGHG